jgi:hypothetical protein
MKKPYIGSSFEDWLNSEGFAEEVHDRALQELIVEHLAKKSPHRAEEFASFQIHDSKIVCHTAEIRYLLTMVSDYLDEIGAILI